MSLTPYFVGLPPVAHRYISNNKLQLINTFIGERGPCGDEYELGLYVEKGGEGDIFFPYADVDSVWIERIQSNSDTGTGGEHRIFSHLYCIAGKWVGRTLDWSREDKIFSTHKIEIPLVGNVRRGGKATQIAA
jgi:hypothetical protein